MTEDERKYATWMHLAGLSTYIGIPFGHVLIPLILWLLRRKQSDYVNQQGIEILNFQLSITFYYIFSWIMLFILIGFVFLPVVFLLHIIATITATVRTHEGGDYRYPATLRVIRDRG